MRHTLHWSLTTCWLLVVLLFIFATSSVNKDEYKTDEQVSTRARSVQYCILYLHLYFMKPKQPTVCSLSMHI